MEIIQIHNIIVADESIKKMHSCILSVLFFNRSNIKRTGTDSCSIYSSAIMNSGKNKFGGVAEKSINCTVWSFSVKPQADCGRQHGFRPYICSGDQTHTLVHRGTDSKPIYCCHCHVPFHSFHLVYSCDGPLFHSSCPFSPY